MPKIPRGKEATPAPLTSGLRSVPNLNAGDQAIGQAADAVFNFTSNLTKERIKSQTRAFASNAYSKDLIDTNNYITQLELNSPIDGSGFTDSINTFLNDRSEARKASAPSGEAYELYSQRFGEMKNRILMRSSSYENTQRQKAVRFERDTLNSEFNGQMEVAPSIDDAIEYSRVMETDIMADVGTHYTALDAITEIQKKKGKMGSAVLSGYDAAGLPEKVIAILRAGVSKKVFNESAEANGIDPNTIPPEDPSAKAAFLDALTPGEKSRRLKAAYAALKLKNKRAVTSDTNELKDLHTTLASKGSSPETTATKEFIVGRIDRNVLLKPAEKVRLYDDTNSWEAMGNAVKRILATPPSERIDNRDVLKQERAKFKEELLNEKMNDLSDLGYPKDQLQEAARLISDPNFNAQHDAQVVAAFDKIINASTAEMLKKPAEYFNAIDSQASTLSKAILDPEAQPVKREGAFSAYATRLDSNFARFNLNTDERKYLTPAMHRFYGGLLGAKTADEGLAKLYSVQREFGSRAKGVFKELVDSGTITEDMYALSTIDPSHSQQLEPIFAMVQAPGRVEEVMKEIDFTKSEGKDLKENITEKMQDMKMALKSADPSGGNVHLTAGLEKLYKVAVINDMYGGSSANESLKKWEKVFVYPVAKSSKSSLVVEKQLEHELPNIEDFINEFDNERSLRTLYRNMDITVDPFHSPIRVHGQVLAKSTVQNMLGQGLGGFVEGFYKDMVNDQAEWITAPDGNSAILALKDIDGTVRPVRDSEGSKIIVPYENMKSYAADKFEPQKFRETGRFGNYDEDGKLIIPKGSEQIEIEENEANKSLEEGKGFKESLASSGNEAMQMIVDGLSDDPTPETQAMADAVMANPETIKELFDRNLAKIDEGMIEFGEGVFNPILGSSKAAPDDLSAMIRGKAKRDGRQAGPEVESEVNKLFNTNISMAELIADEGGEYSVVYWSGGNSGGTFAIGTDGSGDPKVLVEQLIKYGADAAAVEKLKKSGILGLRGLKAKQKLIEIEKAGLPLQFNKEQTRSLSIATAKWKVSEIIEKVGEDRFRQLHPGWQTALVNMAYNTGLKGSKNLVSQIKNGEWREAVKNLKKFSTRKATDEPGKKKAKDILDARARKTLETLRKSGAPLTQELKGFNSGT